jgi:hypothetical protein
MPRRQLVPAALAMLVLAGAASHARAQLGFLAGGGQGAQVSMSWPRYREYRDLPGQSYVDTTPTGRRGYFVPLPMPGYDDIGNGPSRAFSPIFNAPQPIRPPVAAPAAPAPPRPGLFRRLRRGPR